MAQWAYKVAYIDYRGRISSEGLETLIGNERRSTFARRFMNTLGKDGWELVGIQPLTANSAYYVFKRPAQEGDFAEETPPAASTRATARVPTPLHTSPALTMKTKGLRLAADLWKGGGCLRSPWGEGSPRVKRCKHPLSYAI